MKKLGLALLMLGAASCDSGSSGGSTPDGGVGSDAGREALVARGRYLANLAACAFCHTPLNPDGTRDVARAYSGVDCFLDIDPAQGVGCVSTGNLTNHETGLANVSDEDIKAALRDGRRTDGKNLASLMPYWVFHNMTDADLDSLVAYLRTVPGIEKRVRANEPPWSLQNENGPRAVPIDPSTIPLPVTGEGDAKAMRGRYLATMAGLCIDCHSPQLPPTAERPIDMTRPFAGGRQWPHEELGLISPPFPNVVSTRNLTSHATGLAGWTREQVKSGIAEGRDREGDGVCAATHGSVTSPYAALEPEDLDAIADYITKLPPIENDTGLDCKGPPPL
jgi:mono/diheme cytochrome c family protein